MGRGQLISLGKLVLLFVVAVALQVLIVSRIGILGVTADLFLILTVVIAIGRGSMEGALFGFFAGLFAGVAFFQPLGIHSFIYVLVGYFVGMFVGRLGTVTPWAVFLLAGISSFASQFVFGLFQYTMGPRGSFFTMVATQMIPQMVLDALVTVPVFMLLVRLRIIPAPVAQLGPARSASE
jgi:rod shape-determining protein MreD